MARLHCFYLAPVILPDGDDAGMTLAPHAVTSCHHWFGDTSIVTELLPVDDSGHAS
jgi:hypothetical protein